MVGCDSGAGNFSCSPYIAPPVEANINFFTLYLTHTKPIPDFFLRKLNVIVEIYGGHYKAWLRKVKKNHDYRALKIHVISITPSEIWNLDYFLLKQAINLSKTRLAKNFKLERFMKAEKEWLDNLRRRITKLKERKARKNH